MRVAAKTAINIKIHKLYNSLFSFSNNHKIEVDEILYSVGEAIDRLTIEFIKRNGIGHKYIKI